MRINVSTDTWKLRIASLLFAVLCVLLPVENAFAVPLTYNTNFTAADGIRNYMDVAGAWNGFSDDPSIGDTFSLVITNPASSATVAYDIQDIIVTLPTGFDFVSNSDSVNTNGCSNINLQSASQSGNQLTLNINPNNNNYINPGCTVTFYFELRTNTSVASGSNNLNYQVKYNEIDGDIGSVVTDNTPQSINVNQGALSVTKGGPITPVVDGATVTFNVTIDNSLGAGGLYNVEFTDVLGIHFDPASILITTPTGDLALGDTQYTYNYLPAGQSINLTVNVDVSVDAGVTSCPDLINTAEVTDRTFSFATDNHQVFIDTSAALSLIHDGNSFCELCGDGEIILRVQNTNSVTLTNVVVKENLQSTGLVYIDDSASIVEDGVTVASGNAADPSILGTELTWNLSDLYGAATGTSPNIIEIHFWVRRPPNTEEGLTLAVRDIIASATYNDVCSNGPYAANPPAFTLPIQEPIPTIIKEGRNVEAGQNSGNYQPIV